MTRIAIIGAAGRMGQRIATLARERADEYSIVGEIERDGGDLNAAQVAIDFSTPAATRHWLDVCREKKIAMLIGTTGLSNDDHAAIDRAAREIAILQATNTSMGVAVLNRLVADATRMLGEECDIEIVETHHKMKRDAPSGTAQTLAESVGRNVPTHSLRIGDEVGTHTVYFALPGERLELTHRALSRDVFALGALRASTWVARCGAGRYRFAEFLESLTRP